MYQSGGRFHINSKHNRPSLSDSCDLTKQSNFDITLRLNFFLRITDNATFRSDLLNRRQQNHRRSVPRNVSAETDTRHNRQTSRRSSEATRNRSLVRQAQANDRLQSSNYSRNQDKHKIVENRRSHRRDKKSVKSTEGSSKKSSKVNILLNI